jgi:hypothetical protein
MLYMITDDSKLKIIVLETPNMEELMKGRPAMTPDGSILIAWTPDPVWLADQILGSKGDGALILKAIDEASRRPQKERRKYHAPITKNLHE